MTTIEMVSEAVCRMPLCADAVEFRPPQSSSSLNSEPPLLACATYQLDTNTRKRDGAVYFFRIGSNDSDDGTQRVNLRNVDKVHQVGVLDIKWSWSSPEMLCIADSIGGVSLYSIKDDQGDDQQVAIKSLGKGVRDDVEEDQDLIALSIDWSDRVHRDPNNKRIVCSYNDGSVGLWNVSEDGSEVTLSRMWSKVHEYEAWIAAFDYHDTNVFYSGSDDCKLKGWDVRIDGDSPTFVLRGNTGFTTVQSHPHLEHYVAVGSYDGIAQVFDKRAFRSRRPLTSLDIGGGVWRLKWHPSRNNLLAAAGMHSGFHILSVDGIANGSGELQSLESYHQPVHTSLAYGIDWSPYPNFPILSACSFYDRMCSLWQPKEM